MTISAAQLLKQLEPAVRPGPAPSTPGLPSAAIESQSFDQLLALASRGGIHSGRQITVGFEPALPIDPSQLERLAAAADQAEAAGAKRALMLIDGRGFVLDVASRTLVAELDSRQASTVQNIDAAVFVARDDESQLGILALPGANAMPAQLYKQLESLTLNNEQKKDHPRSSPGRTAAA